MACPAASSSINMLGIARENIYDDYSSASTPTAPYAIFSQVIDQEVNKKLKKLGI